MTNYLYAREKMYSSMCTLAIGHGDVRSRLLNAFMGCHALNEGDLPPEFRKDWNWIVKQMTKYGPLYGYKDKYLGGLSKIQ